MTVCAVTVMVALWGVRFAGGVQVAKLASHEPPQISPAGEMETAAELLEEKVYVVLTVALPALTATAESVMFDWP